MSLFTQAMDKYQRGENGNVEYAWSKESVQEQFVQVWFQCVRTTTDGLRELSQKFDTLLDSVAGSKDVKKEYLVRVIQLIVLTRDIDGGKGERDLTYMMLWILWRHYEVLAKFVLRVIVLGESGSGSGSGSGCVGSWRDIKNLCQYIYQQSNDMTHPFIGYAMDLLCSQLKKDSSMSCGDSISLAARWVPRESSKRGNWIFCALAARYFPEYLASAKTQESRVKAFTKAKMMFSKLIVGLSRRLDTPQIKMCGREWATIDPNRLPSVLLRKNNAAFLNIKKNRQVRYPDNVDRIECAMNLSEYILNRAAAGKNVKGSRVGIVDYVKNAYEFNCYEQGAEVDLLNSQWRDFMSKVGDLGDMVAMVDQSGSMAGDPYYAAMGLGMAIAAKSALGPRVLTFSTEPSWISLEDCSTIIEMTCELKKHDCKAGFGTNFFKALRLILSACVEGKVPDSVVSNMVLVILSDMQIDCQTNVVQTDYGDVKGTFTHSMEVMRDRIVRLYNEAGYSNAPHLLFWNLRHTSGFPCSSSAPGATMFSGFSPLLLNSFCQKGKDALNILTPWVSICELLDKYDFVREHSFFYEGRSWDGELHLGAYS